MKQVTLRLQPDLADAVAEAAASRAQSVNRYVSDVLGAAVDPELAGDELERIRARLKRAGLLADEQPPSDSEVSQESLAKARANAGKGTPLSDLVSEGRR